MARTPKLSDLHYVLLATAANRASGSLLPPSVSIKQERANITKAITALIRRGFAEEVATKDTKSMWREEEGQCLAAVISEAGRAALNLADSKEPEASRITVAPAANVERPAVHAGPSATPVAMEPPARPGTKQAQLIELLRRKNGASITELVEALSWLLHTTRAALTGLRKKGHVIASDKVDGVTRYRLPVAG